MARKEIIVCDMCGKTTETVIKGVVIDELEKELCPACKAKIDKLFQPRSA